MDNRQRGNANRETGSQTEQLAAEYFIKEGYTIREQNWKMNHYEIDLILEKDRTLIFVEVKSRKPGSQDPVDAVDSKKMKRLISAADSYLQRESLLYQYRFDIVTFTGENGEYEMHHYPDAFLPPLNSGRK